MAFQTLDVPQSPLLSFQQKFSSEAQPQRNFHDSSLSYLEDRLDREQKLRETLELELRSGKNVMAQLNTKIEHLYAQSNLPIKHSEDLNTNLVRFEAKKDLERLSDGMIRKFEQVSNDHTLIKQRIDKSSDVSGKKIKQVVDEVDQLKHHLVFLLQFS